jgi:hypothetical protein
MHGSDLAVYSQGRGTSAWNRALLTDQLGGGHALWTANLDGRQGDEVIIGWRNPSKDTKRVGLAVYSESASGWDRALIDDNGMACEDVTAADLDADSKPEIIASGRSTHNLKIYWNRLLHSSIAR